MKKQPFSLRKRIRSFGYAFHGLKLLFREEHNFRIQIIVAFLAVVAGIILQLSRIEWMAVTLTAGLVLTAEAVNTSIEHLCNFISPKKHRAIKHIKDLSAAAVLLASMAAVAAGLLIFIPKLIPIFTKIVKY